MKKIFLMMMMLLGLGTLTSLANDNTTLKAKSANEIEEWLPLDVKDLPEEVKETLAMDYVDYSVSAAKYEIVDEGEVNYIVVLLNQENMESMILLSDDGEVVE